MGATFDVLARFGMTKVDRRTPTEESESHYDDQTSGNDHEPFLLDKSRQGTVITACRPSLSRAVGELMHVFAMACISGSERASILRGLPWRVSTLEHFGDARP